jgi:hypothetical protein
VTFERGYEKFSGKPLVPASEARVSALEAAVVVPDGVPPASSPAATVRPAIGALEVRWTPVTNSTPVTYALYAEPAVPVEDPESGEITSYVDMIPGPSNQVAKDLVGSIAYIRTLNDGTPIQADMTYAVRIIASDYDGSAAAGAQGVASPAKITSPDIAAETILGEHIAGGTITGRELAGEIVLGSKITTGGLDSSGNTVGQRVDLDADGLRVISASGTPLVDLPTDPAKPAAFDGDVTARTLLITGGTSFQSPYNEITSDSGLTLAAGVSNPSGKPGLVIGYESVTLQRVSRAGQSGDSLGTFALDPTRVTAICPTSNTNVFWVVEVRTNGSRIWRYNLTTGQNVQDSAGNYVWDYPEWRITGIAMRDDGKDAWIGQWAGNNKWYVNRNLNTPPLNTYDARVGIGDPTIVTDGTDWFIMESRSGASLGQMIVRRIGWNSTNFGEVPKTQDITLGATTGSTIGTHISGGRVGAMDMGGSRVAYMFRSASTGIRVTNHSAGATRDPALEWPSGISSDQRGFMWHPPTSTWYALDAAGVLIKYTSQNLSGGSHWHIATTIYDSKAAGTGTHETMIGPIATVAMRKRALLRVSIPTVPVSGGGDDDPDKYRLYAAQNSSATPPASSSFRFQSEGTTPTTGPGSATLTAIASATAAPPTTNNFPSATPAYIRSIANDGGGNPRWNLKGDGAGNVGNISWAANGSSGVVRFNARGSSTSTPSTGTAGANVATATLVNPVNGRTYRVTVSGGCENNTAGQFTNILARHGSGVSTGGTDVGRWIMDHRAANRTEGFSFYGEFTYTGTTGATGYNVVLVFSASGGTSTIRGDLAPSLIVVDEVL